MSLPFNIWMSVFLGFFVGIFTTFIGTVGGSAIMIYLLLFWKIIPSPTKIAGTMLLISCIPLGIFGLYDFYKNKQIDYYYGSLIAAGLIVGLVVGSKTNFLFNDIFSEKKGDQVKFTVTSIVFFVLSILYAKMAFF